MDDYGFVLGKTICSVWMSDLYGYRSDLYGCGEVFSKERYRKDEPQTIEVDSVLYLELKDYTVARLFGESLRLLSEEEVARARAERQQNMMEFEAEAYFQFLCGRTIVQAHKTDDELELVLDNGVRLVGYCGIMNEFACYEKTGTSWYCLKEQKRMFTQEDVKSAIMGFAVADAFGVPGEFIPREKLQANPITEMMGYGSHDVPAGSWSDDTSMTLCTVESIAEKRGIDLDDIMQRFCRWVDEGYMTPQGRVFDIGRTCMHAIGGYQRGQDVYHCGGGREYDNGNGSLMRILPVCFYNLAVDATPADSFETIYRVSALTHAHDRACLACAIYCEYLKSLLFFPAENKPTPVECVKRFEDKPQFEHFKRLASHDFGDLPMEEIRSSGYSVDSLEAAIWCFLNTDSYQDCVIQATNLGQDTDTVAALAGGLAGAFYGYDAIPAQWADTLIQKDEILTLCDNFYATLKDLHDETEATHKEGNWAVVEFGDGYRRSMPVRKLAMAFEQALELERLRIKSGETAYRAELMYALDIIKIDNSNGYEAEKQELQRLTDYYRDIVTHPRVGDPQGEQSPRCRACRQFIAETQKCPRFPKRIPKEVFWDEWPCEDWSAYDSDKNS